MKKLFGILLAAAMTVTTMAGAVYAEEASNPNVISLDRAGMDLDLSALKDVPEFTSHLGLNGGGELSDGIYLTELTFYGVDPQLLQKEEYTDEDIEYIQDRSLSYLFLIGLRDGISPEDAQEIIELNSDDVSFNLVGEDDGYSVYSVEFATTPNLENVDSEYAEVFQKGLDLRDELLDSCSFYAPIVLGSTILGSKVDLECTDMDGNPVKLSDVLGENEITMVNLWATWCGYCINEFPELSEINERLQDKNCGIVCLLYADEEDTAEDIELAKSLIEKSGASQTFLVAPAGAAQYLPNDGSFPVSYYLDSEGTILSLPILGAQVSKYEPTFEKLLNSESTEVAPAKEANAEEAPAEETAAEEAPAEEANAEEANVEEAPAEEAPAEETTAEETAAEEAPAEETTAA